MIIGYKVVVALTSYSKIFFAYESIPLHSLMLRNDFFGGKKSISILF